jgi:hypothetical protein
MSWPKSKLISSPASPRRPCGRSSGTIGRCTRRRARLAQLVGRHRHRPEGGGRLALQETEPLASSAGIRLRRLQSLTSISSRMPVQRGVGRGAHRHVAGDHRDLGLEVDAPVLGRRTGVVAGAEEVVAAALVHQRVVQKSRACRRCAPCAPARRGSGRPSRRPTGRRAAAAPCTALRLEGEGMARLARVQRLVEVLQLRRDEVPVVQRCCSVVAMPVAKWAV